MTSYRDFDGVIGPTVAESVPSWPARPHPGASAPNVVVILLDDLGFAQLGCYGSTMRTPNIDRLAANGLRYTNFHVTPLCSPTRAALLTGRNHHEVGMRSLANFNTGYPNMRGHISNNAATMAEVLRETGYATFAIGKWHLCQMEDASAAGPYDQWPIQRGFERFYGFLDGETDQFHPELVYDNHRIDPPGRQAYHLTEDLIDHAIGFIHDSVSIRPDRPFFLYLATGAMHAPHQAPPAYLARYRGAFDDGWDVARDAWFARQRQMGLLPATTKLAPRNPGVQGWSELPENHKRLAARLQEAFAAFLDHTDEQIGRLVTALARLGRLGNTVIMLLSDNGASQEGGQFGVLHEWKYFNFVTESPDQAVARLDDIGGPDSHANYPWGWAQAGNTPFKWYKQNTHEGGVHVPLIVHWPAQLDQAARGGLRHQFHHVNDIAPTIYDLLGVTPPTVYLGYEQMPVTGTSMRYTLADGDAPTRKNVQYFEMMGHRGIYSDGWKAVTRHTPGVPYDDDDWELYHVAADRSECVNLAQAEPQRLAAMIGLWWRQAREHGVLPLDDRSIELFGGRDTAAATQLSRGLAGLAEGSADRPSPHPRSRHYTYWPPLSPIPMQAAARISGRSWDLDAMIGRPAGAGGVIYATGNQNSGFSFFVQHDRLVFDYNCFGDHHVGESDAEVPTGESVVGVRFRRTGQHGHATFVIDGRECGRVDLPFVMLIISSVGPSVGFDHDSAVSRRYQAPFRFEGQLHRVDIQIVSSRRPDGQPAGSDGPADQAAAQARESMSRQ